MKAWKLQECVAHSPGSVTSLALGRKSGRVMATGGEDRRVKLWAVGKPTCILSLTGHTSSVEATEFSQEEDRVAAGSLSGSIRIWDLEQVKIVRALSGHTSGISSLDFHPFGNFVASGSVDTLVKLWDVSRKGCINTYRGHCGGVNVVRFSPDGKWVVSGGEDGAVKLWDLSAGRLLAELPGHTGSVTAVAFHPTVLLLATASADRTVRLFDLENFSQIAVSGAELSASVIRRIAFHPDGVCLYVANMDYLKIYDYETMTCLETVHVGWRTAGGLDDMAIAPSFNQLVGASISSSLVSTYVVDIKSCIPFVGDPAVVDVLNPSGGSGGGNSACPVPNSQPDPVHQLPSADASLNACQANGERPFTRCGSSNTTQNSRNRKSFCLSADDNRRNILQEDPSDPEAQLPYKPSAEEQSEMATTMADITDPEEYDRVFKPNRTVPRSPTRTMTQSTRSRRSPPSPPALTTNTPINPGGRPSPPGPAAAPAVTTTSVAQSETADRVHNRSPVISVRSGEDAPFTPPEQPTNRRVPTLAVHKSKRTSSDTDCSSVSDTEQLIAKFAPKPDNSRLQSAISVARGDSPSTTASNEPSESEWLMRVRRPHGPFMTVLAARLKALSTVRVMWTRDNTRTAVETALTLNEPAVLIDLLSVLAQNEKLWNLDLCHSLLPHLAESVRSKYTAHVETTCQAVRLILKNFAQLIRQTVDGPKLPGVDLMHEERLRKCRDCLDHLLSIRSALDSKEVASKAGQYGRELLVLFQLLS